MKSPTADQPNYCDNDIESILDRLTRYYPVSIDLDTSRLLRLMDGLGNPHLSLPPVIHIAGTNGKGSTLAFIKSILEQAGLRVHRFSSPHLVRYNERVNLAGQDIDNDMLHDVITRCEQANNGAPITFFEITTAASFLAFSMVPADIILLETGLGGRLDATNIIPDPLLTIITTISMDHEAFLGDSLDKIAGEKAGIFKQNRPTFIGYQRDDAIKAGVMNVFKAKAASLNCPIHICQDMDLPIQSPLQSPLQSTMPCPKYLPGRHQIHNARTAMIIADYLRQHGPKSCANITDSHIINGIENAHWPARLQYLDDLSAQYPGTSIFLDGGHNDSAGDALADHAQYWRDSDQKSAEPPQDLYVIMAMMNNKSPAAFLKNLHPYIRGIVTLPIPDHQDACFSAQDLADNIARHFSDHITKIDHTMPEALENTWVAPKNHWRDALSFIQDHITGNNDKKNRILICGSLYQAGYILKEIV